MEIDFRNPDYTGIFRERAERLAKLRSMSPEEFTAIWMFYKDNPVQFIDDWGMTYDPRNLEDKRPALVPFKLFDKQKEFVNWVYERWFGKEDGVCEKSRDMGVSWLCVAISVHMWIFYSGTCIAFGSRKEPLVDKLGDPKSLFWKIREFIKLLPQEFLPIGFNLKKDMPEMLIKNTENGSTIVGEAGDNIGRGARASVYFVDEAAFLERADSIEAALSQTGNCKIYVSTPNGNGNVFYRKRHSGKVPVFTFHWTQDPRKDDKWYEKQVTKYDSVIVAQEIDLDYNASVDNSWLGGVGFEDAFMIGRADLEAIGPKILGVDVAHLGNDESVLTLRQGRVVLWQKIYTQVDGEDLAGIIVYEADRMKGVNAIVVELDGPGASVYDRLKRSDYKNVVCPVHTGNKRKDGRNYNLRAKCWRSLKEWFEDGPVSIPRDPELKSQACAMGYSYKGGLLLMENKKEYKARLGKSPDRADSLALTFAIDWMPADRKQPVRIPRVVTGFERSNYV